MSTELRLCDEDRKAHGDESTPEWVTFDKDALDELPFDQLHAWEREMGVSAVLLVGREFATFTALGIKGVVWLAWKMAGLETPDFEDFNIKTMKVEYKTTKPARVRKGADADPPADGSSEPSSGTTES